MIQKATVFLVALALLAPSFPLPLIAEDGASITPLVSEPVTEIASSTPLVAEIPVGETSSSTASTTDEITDELIVEEGIDTGGEDAPVVEPMLFQALADESYEPSVSGTVIMKTPGEYWDPARWDSTASINFPHSIQLLNTPYFVQHGRITAITLPLGSSLSPDTPLYFQLASDGIHSFYDCKTPTKTAAQWGLGPGANSFTTVTVGPFDGNACDTRMQVPAWGTGLIAVVPGSSGSSVFFPYNASAGAAPIIAYSANLPTADRITADITTDTTLHGDRTYVVSGRVSVGSGATLTIEPGAIVKFDSALSSLNIDGTLIAHGTTTNPIYFTSFRDDAGGDTNQDGNATSPAPGDWEGIIANLGSISIQHAIVRYGSERMLTGDLNTLVIHHSSITNAVLGVKNYFQNPGHEVNAQNNWWGDPTGPSNNTPSNYYNHLVGSGQRISPTVFARPWLTSDPFATSVCTENCNSSVLFLPGIKGSRLYGADELLWEPGSNDDMLQLFLGPDGKSIRTDITTKKQDVLRSAFGLIDIYDDFIGDLSVMYDERTIKDYEAVAYDWRLSLGDIVNNGAEQDGRINYAVATSTPYIEQTLKRLAANSYTDKVTIVAHSNGGLVTKALLQKLGDTETARLVDKIIFVGVPQSGAPQAIASALYGYKESVPFVVSNATAREVAENSPMTYHLMPSARYFSDVQDPEHPVVSFSGTYHFLEERALYGDTIETEAELASFLLALDGGRTKPPSYDTDRANVLNPALVSYGSSLHASLDAWVPPAAVELTQIAGWGLDTISGIQYYEPCPFQFCGATYKPIIVEDGDGVVPVPSALMTSTETSNVHNYWLNLKPLALGPFLTKDHGNVFETEQLRDFIGNVFISSSPTLTDFIFDSQPENVTPTKKLRFFLHSPLTLELYDEAGNHLGYNPDGSFDQEIEDAEYGEFGEVKYIFVPAGKEYELKMRGLDTGTFSLDIQETEGNQIITETTFANVPATPETVASLTIQEGITDASPLQVDGDGDGVSEVTIVPAANETIVYGLDEVPPVTTVSFSGPLALNGWYTGTTTGTLTATDEGSGVATTSYALDEGPWLTYNAPVTLTKEGTTTLQFYSTDVAGNREATSTETIRIDKTAPEAIITLDIAAKLLKIAQVDTLSATSTPATLGTGKSSVLTDAAGNKLHVTYSKNEQKPTSVLLSLSSLNYGSTATTSVSANIRYYWLNGPKASSPPSVLLAHIKTAEEAVLALYIASSNKTILMSATPKDDSADLGALATTLVLKPRATLKQYQGLVIPYVFTQKGKVRIGY